MSRVDLEGIRKTFGDVVALDDVSFGVENRSFFVLLGPSGAGKTTTLRVIAGLERPDRGVVRLGGADAGAASPAARDVAMVFQSYALYPKRTVFDNIASPLRARRLPADEVRSRVGATAELLHITRLLQRRPSQLSGGEQQRVALGRALVRQPRAYLMDEPLTNLDVKLRVEMRAELTRLHRQLGNTFVYVTNDQAEAMSMADRVAVLADGRIQQVGTPDEVYGAPANRFVARFVGSVRMNLLACRVDGDTVAGDAGWRLPVPPDVRTAGHADVELGVRAEDLRLLPAEPTATDQPTDPTDAAGAATAVDGEVYAVEPLGDRTIVDVAVGDDIVRVKARPDVMHAVGDRVRVAVDIERSHLFAAGSGESLRDATAWTSGVGPASVGDVVAPAGGTSGSNERSDDPR